MTTRNPILRSAPAVRLLAILTTLLLALAVAGSAMGANSPGKGRAGPTFLLPLTGGDGPNVIEIAYDGTQFIIKANGTLTPPPEKSCTNPIDDPMELDC